MAEQDSIKPRISDFWPNFSDQSQEGVFEILSSGATFAKFSSRELGSGQRGWGVGWVCSRGGVVTWILTKFFYQVALKRAFGVRLLIRRFSIWPNFFETRVRRD